MYKPKSRPRKLLGMLVSLLIITGVGFAIFKFLEKPVVAAWFDDSWSYRQIISITGATAQQTDYQSLISVDTATLVSAGKMQSDCDDIRITDNMGKVLNYWIEPTTCNTSATRIWAKVPLIPTTGAKIYIYYGNTAALAPTTSTADVFIQENSNVQGAWSMDEGSWTNNCSTGTILDSSGNGLHGKACPNSTGPTGGTAGKFNNGGLFDGNDDYGEVIDNSLLKPATFSVAFWVYKVAEPADFERIIQKTSESNTGWQVPTLNDVSNKSLYFSVFNSAGTAHHVFTSAYPISTWKFFVFTFDGSNLRGYENGSATSPTAFSGTYNPATQSLWFARSNGGGNTNIILDQVRFYDSVLSQSQVSALYGTGGDRMGYVTTNYANRELVRKFDATLTVGSPASEEKSPAPVAYWRFDQGADNLCSGGSNDACNFMGNTAFEGAFGATTAAPAWKTDDLCLSDKCIYFDGSNDILSDTTFGSFSSDFTISLWVKAPNQTTGNNRFLEMSQGASAGFNMFMLSNGSVNIDNNGGPTSECNSTAGFGDMAWHHVVATRTGTTYALYVDGKHQESCGGTAPTYDRVYLGTQLSGATFWKGFMDEFKVYSYARTAAQIKADFASRGSTDGVAATLGANDDNNPAISNGLAGYWKLDEASGNATDYSGNATTLTDTNTVARVAGLFGNTGDFESGSSEYLYAADNAPLSITGDLTLAAWIKTESTGGFKTIIAKVDNTGRDSYKLDVSNTEKLRLALTDSSDVASVTVSDQTISTGVWYHVAGIYNQADRSAKLYINGQLANSTTTGTIPAALEDNDGRFHLGTVESSGTPTAFMDGLIEEARVYNRTLDPKSIEALYNWAPGPSGHWKMDENTGTTSTYDSTGGGFTGTLTSSPSWVAGKYGSALSFNGSSNYVANSSATPTTSVSSWTLTAWIKPAALSSLSLAFYNGNDSGGYGFGMGDGAGNAGSKLVGLFGGVTWIDSGYTFASANSWYHIAMTRDGTTTRFYVNGVQTTSTSASTPGALPSSRFSIGMEYTGANAASRYFNGVIDDAKIYNYPRTLKQIVEDMNGSHPAGGSPVASQIGYWALDEQQGQTANNKGFGASMNGTLGGSSAVSTDDPTWKLSGTSTCKINGCQSFDAGDFTKIDSATLTNFCGYNASTGFSISSWFKFNTAPSNAAIFMLGSSSTNTPICGLTSTNGFIRFEYRSDNNIELNGGAGIWTQNTYNDGAWHHAVVVRNGSDFRIYIDGILRRQITDASGFNTVTTNQQTIGATRRVATAAQFDGWIDEVKIYNGALTPDEVKIDYNNGSAIALGGVLGTQDNEGFGGNPPVGYWDFNDNTGTDAVDKSGRGYTLAGTGTSYTRGKIGSGLLLDAVSDIAQCTDAACGGAGNLELDSSSVNGFTMEAWVYPTAATSNTYYIIKTGATDAGFALRRDTDGFNAFFGNNGCTNNSTAVGVNSGYPSNQWYHLAVTLSAANPGTATLYVNGVSVASSGSHYYCNGTGNFRVGAGTSSTALSTIDEIKIYQYVRSQAQIMYDYNRGAPTYWYKFDECQGATAYNSAPAATGLAPGTNGAISAGDSSGDNDTVGTCDSGTSTEMWNDGSTGKINSSLGLDGTNDIVDLSTSAGLVTATGDYTLSAWINPTDITSVAIYGQGNSANTTQAFRFAIDANSKLYLHLINDSDVATSLVSTSSIPASTWTHVVATKNGSAVKLYLNGVLNSSGTISTSGSYTFNTSSVGYLNRSSDIEYFAGQIDEMRIYGYPLSDNQVKQVFNNGAVFFGPVTGTP